jgi:hypothetical protein
VNARDQPPYALKLTAAGLKTIVVEGGSEQAIEPSETARVIGLPRGSNGVTIFNLSEATGWLPHTTPTSKRQSQRPLQR